MKKGIITMSVLAIIACTITAYCWAAGNETVSESANAAQSLSGQQVKSTSQDAKGKTLVVYFSVPETDDVDASSGASRLVFNGKVMGNTQYIASVISEATGSDLFEIKTVHTYPGSHKALIDAAKRGEIPSGEIALVLASNDKAYALTRAAENNIPSVVVKRKEFETQLAYEEAVKAVLAENSIDMIVLAGFMSILSENFTAAYPKRIVNVHPSLIPSFCGKGFYGLHVHEAALAYGVKVTGATVHYVNEIPDGGEIILQKAVEIEEGDTPEVLQRRVMEQAEWILLPKAVEMVAARLQKGQ